MCVKWVIVTQERLYEICYANECFPDEILITNRHGVTIPGPGASSHPGRVLRGPGGVRSALDEGGEAGDINSVDGDKRSTPEILISEAGGRVNTKGNKWPVPPG